MENYPSDTDVTLQATPASGSIFGGWNGGSCTGTQNTCTVSMTESKGVAATFIALAPDFRIMSIVLTPSTPTVHEQFTVKVTVKNEGTLAGGKGAALRLWDNQTTAPICSARSDAILWDMGNIPAGQSKALTFTRTAVAPSTAWEKKTLRVFVDGDCIIPESNEENNQATKLYSVHY